MFHLYYLLTKLHIFFPSSPCPLDCFLTFLFYSYQFCIPLPSRLTSSLFSSSFWLSSLRAAPSLQNDQLRAKPDIISDVKAMGWEVKWLDCSVPGDNRAAEDSANITNEFFLTQHSNFKKVWTETVWWLSYYSSRCWLPGSDRSIACKPTLSLMESWISAWTLTSQSWKLSS